MKPYYEHAGIVIYHGDCREVLASLETGSVGLLNADPPYNVGKYYGEGTDDNRPDEEYWHWYSEVFEAALPLMGENTLAYVSSTTNQMYEIRPLIESIGWRWMQTLIWYRPNMIMGPKHKAAPWLQLYEPISLFVKGKRPKMVNPDGVLSTKTHDVLTYASPQSNFAESVDHPTQKPEGLYKALIGRSPGEIVLDPFMGSGTSLVAAKYLGRKAIGIEIEERYCEQAAMRLSQEVLPLSGEVSAAVVQPHAVMGNLR